MRRGQDVVRRQHQDPGLRLRLGAEREVDRHLVAVEVRVERVADERVDLDGLALDEHRLERLDAQAVKRRRAVQQHRVLVDDLLEDVPDLRDHRVDHLLGGLDVLRGLALDEPGHDERLEQLERHQLRQPALVQAQRRAGHDDRAARVVDALAEQVLAEAALLALEHVAQRLQRAVARAGDGAATAAVVEQRVDGLLEHALLVVDDDLRRAEVEQALEPVVAVDDAAVEVVEVRRGEAAAVELDHRAQLRRDHRHGLEDHHLRLVARSCRNAESTFRRLTARACFWPLPFLTWSSRSTRSCSMHEPGQVLRGAGRRPASGRRRPCGAWPRGRTRASRAAARGRTRRPCRRRSTRRSRTASRSGA